MNTKREREVGVEESEKCKGRERDGNVVMKLRTVRKRKNE